MPKSISNSQVVTLVRIDGLCFEVIDLRMLHKGDDAEVTIEVYASLEDALEATTAIVSGKASEIDIESYGSLSPTAVMLWACKCTGIFSFRLSLCPSIIDLSSLSSTAILELGVKNVVFESVVPLADNAETNTHATD